MLTCMIDALEKRDVATVDIPGAFLQTKMPKEEKYVHIVLDDGKAELFSKLRKKLTKSMSVKNVVRHTYIAV